MADWVVCAECNTRYEAAATSFCPRCGSVARAGAPRSDTASPILTRRDPHRLRLQLGGILLTLVGLFFLASATYNALQPAAFEEKVYEQFLSAQGNGTSMRGGDVHVTVMAGSHPVQGANVSLRAGAVPVASGRTPANGTFATALGGYAAVQLNVTVGSQTWTRRIIAPSGLTAQVQIDTATDPLQSERVVGAGAGSSTFIIASVLLSLFLTMGGLAALLARWRGLALAGPLPALALSVLTVVLFLSAGPAATLASLAILAMIGIPYALVLSGRSAFRRG